MKHGVVGPSLEATFQVAGGLVKFLQGKARDGRSIVTPVRIGADFQHRVVITECPFGGLLWGWSMRARASLAGDCSSIWTADSVVTSHSAATPSKYLIDPACVAGRGGGGCRIEAGSRIFPKGKSRR